MKKYENSFFDICKGSGDGLAFLGYPGDPSDMNWIEGKKKWGETVVPDGISVSVDRQFTKEGNFQETYTFTNSTRFPMFFPKTDIGVYATFNDNYQEASTCLGQRCHTHIFCGGQAAYVMALRMSGRGPHLGLKVIEGSIEAYSVERDLEQRSNDRGDFILHPGIGKLEPGESARVVWELFWYETREDFVQNLLDTPGFPVVLQDQCTWFTGEMIVLKVACREKSGDRQAVIRCKGQDIHYQTEEKEGVTWITAEIKAEEPGECRCEIEWGNRRTYALFYICESVEKLASKRCCFLAEKQQCFDENSRLNGAYIIYDGEEKRRYYSHRDDHNGGRERLAMGVLMAYWLRRHPDKRLEWSLEQYVNYVYRELYDGNTGTVFNDIGHNLDWDRLYNYPWMAQFQLELYHLKGEEKYLSDVYRTLMQYYRKGGIHFYGIGVPAEETRNELMKRGRCEEADILKSMMRENADEVLKNGLCYPESEVAYEQSIVAPAVSCLLQAYEGTGEEKYLDGAKQQLEVLSLFNGRQPDYHLYENAIRHWDGYWFGKYRRYGDTFPHYWSVLTGVEYLRYERLTGDKSYRARAEASLRGCLNLFFEDGAASCAMVFPEKVNGEKGRYYDPWANDQDWALYYALRYLSD